MYKACILTAGIGTRNAYAKRINKSLLMLNGKPVLFHIIDKIPKDVEIVIAVGFMASNVIQDVMGAYADRDITFVQVDKIEGEGSGPGYSLLQCKPHLNCPFIFTACDTIVLENYPMPYWDWVGVDYVDETQEYLTLKTKGRRVDAFYDKVTYSPTNLAFIGVAGIKSYELFWEGLCKPTLAKGEHQVTCGLEAIATKGLRTRVFTWFDTGTTEGYDDARRYFTALSN